MILQRFRLKTGSLAFLKVSNYLKPLIFELPGCLNKIR